ncbi:uncharacterized protein LOC115314534 [Ixodes scapularis]|uniref:uncharacterized protein LOC115314534 n=1 Tax=Ixodes scapularis TaxID=6945 RepID=UPI001A9CF68E|nr:uncharacterized protein LOC115314534 [Ixodes scapularis]
MADHFLEARGQPNLANFRKEAKEALDSLALKIKCFLCDGIVNGKAVKVLRDTGSNTVIVRRELVASEDFTGKVSPVFLVDGRCLMLPEANIRLVSPFLTGQVTVKCMDHPLNDVILGNIHGAKDSTKQTLKEVSDAEGEIVAAVNGSMPSRLSQLSNGGSARERGDLRLSQWGDVDAKGRLKSRSTTHEQYLEKEKLLQQVFDMKKPVYPKPRRMLYPRSRLKKRDPEAQTVVSPLGPTDNYPVPQIDPHDSVPTEFIKGYSLAGADPSVSPGEDTIEHGNGKAKRKCQDGRQEFLERQVDREQMIQEKELHLEERRLKLDEEQLAFERTKFEAEMAVKVRRLDMEEEERRICDGTDKMHLELMKKMFDELVRKAL